MTILKRYLHPHVYCNIIYNSQNTETTQVSINQQIGKENVAYTYNGTLLGHKKEGNPAIWRTWMNSEGIMLSEISQTKKEKYCVISFTCELLKKKTELIETECRLVAARDEVVREISKGDERVTTFRCKMSKFWGSNVQHGD